MLVDGTWETKVWWCCASRASFCSLRSFSRFSEETSSVHSFNQCVTLFHHSDGTPAGGAGVLCGSGGGTG